MVELFTRRHRLDDLLLEKKKSFLKISTQIKIAKTKDFNEIRREEFLIFCQSIAWFKWKNYRRKIEIYIFESVTGKKIICCRAHTMFIVTRLKYKWQKTTKWFGLWYQSSDIKSYRYIRKKIFPFLVVTREKRRLFYPTALTLPSHLYFLYGYRICPLLRGVNGVYACWPFVVAAGAA